MLKKCDTRLSHHFPHNKLNQYGLDGTNKITYEFNSLGFRGEEYNPKAKRLIYVAGCSHTFGTGLKLEDSWPYQFKELLIKKENLPAEDVNLLNFSVGAQSNDYVSRILLTQSQWVKPDMIMVYFPAKERSEYIYNSHKNENFNGYVNGLGPWQINEGGSLTEALSFYTHYTDESGYINMLKNMLLLQFYCKSNGTDYIFSCVEDPFDENFSANPVCKQFSELLDSEYIYGSNLESIDIAVDNQHAGPKSNKLFSEKMFKFYQQKISNKTNR